MQVPHSAGTRSPALTLPSHACDCHMHVFDPRFPPSPHWQRSPPNAPVEAYRKLQQRIGTSRAVIVNPSTYGIDNRCTLDALAALGDSARGVTVIGADITDAELLRMNELGVVGIRVNFVSPQSWGKTTPGLLTTLARRIAPLGWHVQVFMLGEQIVALCDVLRGLPVPLVIDHFGRVPQPAGIADPAFAVIRKLLDHGNTWIKLSGAYMDSIVGAPTYEDLKPIAQAYVEAAPERVVWGSDWPHTTATGPIDDAVLVDLLTQWAPDSRIRHRVLVENPQVLYRFDAAQRKGVSRRQRSSKSQGM
jgi:D-galactarolactone isomerase